MLGSTVGEAKRIISLFSQLPRLASSRSFWLWKTCAWSASVNQNGGWFCGTSDARFADHPFASHCTQHTQIFRKSVLQSSKHRICRPQNWRLGASLAPSALFPHSLCSLRKSPDLSLCLFQSFCFLSYQQELPKGD